VGYDLTAAAETVAELSPMGDTPQPQSERQVRPLRAVDPAERAEAAGAEGMSAMADIPVTARCSSVQHTCCTFVDS